MERFTVQGNEYELKITFASVKHLNALHEGGALHLVAKAITGDVNTFVNIIYASLFHTEKNFPLKIIEKEIEMLFEKGELDVDAMVKIGNDIICNSFFYKKTVAKMMKDEKTKLQFEMLLSE